MRLLPAMSFGDWFCFSRTSLQKDSGIGGGGWVYPKGANSMAASGLISRNDLVGTGRKQVLSSVGPPLTIGRDLTRRLSRISVKNGRNCLWEQF